MRVFVLLIGRGSVSSIHEYLSRFAISYDDDVIVLSEFKSYGRSQLYHKLYEYVTKSYSIKPKLISIPSNLSRALALLLTKVFHRDASYIVLINGYSRYLAIYTLMALVISGKVASIYVLWSSKRRVNEVNIPRHIVLIMQNVLDELKIKILMEVIRDPGVCDEDLALRLRKRLKVIKSAVSELNRLGLVVRRGRRACIYPTEVSKLLVKENMLPKIR